MTGRQETEFRIPETTWVFSIIVLSAAVLLLTYWCLAQGITIIFMHLYYFPIVLMAYHYRWKGAIGAALLSFGYLSLSLLFASGEGDVISAAVFRISVFIGIAIIIAYLSERLVTVQEKQQEMQQFQESVIANANVWISVLSPDGTILVWNDAAEQISGYKKADVIGKKSVWKMMYPEAEYRRFVTAEIRQALATEQYLVNFETIIRCADGTDKNLVWNTRALRDPSGNLTSYIAIGRDLTAQKTAEQDAGERSRFLTTTIDSLPVPVFFKDTNGKFIGSNRLYEEYIGVDRASLLGKTVHDVIPEDLASRYHASDQEILKNRVAHQYETQIERPDGTRVDVIVYKAPYFNTEGNLAGLIGAVLDISERKRSEEVLRESEEKIRLLLNSAAEGIYGIDLKGNCTFCNNACVRMLGYPHENDLLGKNMHWQIHGKHADGSVFPVETCRIFQAFRKGEGTHVDDEVFWRADGASFPVEYWSYPQRDKGRVIGAVVTFLDSTEKKGAEERIQKLLRIQEEQLRIINASPAISFLWKAEENWPVESVSKNISQFGYSPEDFTSGSIPFSSIIHPEDLDRVGSEVLHNSNHNIDDYVQEYRIFGKNHQLFWITDYTHIRRDATGRITHYEGIVLDSSDRKNAEMALKETNDYLTSLFDYANAPIIVWDPEFRITRFNHAFEHLTGRSAKDVIGEHLAILFPEESQDSSMDHIQVTLAGVRWESVEIPILHVSGEVHTVLWNSATLYADDGKTVIATIAQGQDISDRKRIEAAFHESRQLFMDIISFLPDPTFVIDAQGKVLAWNRALEQLSGVRSEEIIGKGDHEYSIWVYGRRRPTLIDLVLDPDKDSARLNYTDILWHGQTVTAQTVVTLSGGKKKVPLSLVASPLIDQQGRVTGAIESMRDISRIKEAEEELARFNENLEKIIRDRTQALNDEIVQRKYAEQEAQAAFEYTRSVIEANPDLMVVLDDTGIILDINTAGEKLTGIPRDRLIGSAYSLYLMDDSTPPDILSQLREKGRAEYTVQLQRSDGQITPLSVHSTLFAGTDNGDVRVIVAAHDISRQKADEAAIRRALEEQVVLLREVHHRVKNNLQIIISLTNLQMRKEDDPAVKQILAETQNRVRAMSLVHEKLYRSKSLSEIEFADYTRFLATQLFSFYMVDTRRVKLEVTVQKMMVDINTAVPLGIVMNELISNALKHAFPDNRSGTIAIRGEATGERIDLVISDDGVGMPEGLDINNTGTLGMRLALGLLDQIDGTLTQKPGPGTTFVITITKPATPDGRQA